MYENKQNLKVTAYQLKLHKIKSNIPVVRRDIQLWLGNIKLLTDFPLPKPRFFEEVK